MERSTCIMQETNRGDPSALDEPPPVPVHSVVAGDNNPCGLRKSDSFPICWGRPPLPAAVPMQAPAKAVASASRVACAIREDTSVINCWGDANGGEIPPAGEFTALRFSTGSYCASRTDGTLACWGVIKDFMLPNTPQGSFRDFCVGELFGCGIHPDGTLACWGLNTRGQASPPPR